MIPDMPILIGSDLQRINSDEDVEKKVSASVSKKVNLNLKY